MKAILCILGVLVAAMCINAMLPEIEQAFEECRTEIGMPDEKPKGPPNMDDPKVKCFHACVMKKRKQIIDGKIVPQKIVEFFMKFSSKASLKEKVTVCATTANEQTDECEVASTMHRCIADIVEGPRH